MKLSAEQNQIPKELDILEESENISELIQEKGNKLYGNDINIKRPRNLGNLRAYFYIKDYPLIVMGPKRNIFINIIFTLLISSKFICFNLAHNTNICFNFIG